MRHRQRVAFGLVVILGAVAGCTPETPATTGRGFSWDLATELALFGAGSFRGFDVGLDESGLGVLGFGVDGTIWSSEDTGGGFAPPRRIDLGPQRFVRGPRVAIGLSGLAFAAWEQPPGDRPLGPMLVWASRFERGSGWEMPTVVESRVTAPQQRDPAAANLAPEAAVDPSGNAVMVWKSEDVFASASLAGRGWGPPERIDVRRGAQGFGEVRVRATSQGRFVAAWCNGPQGRVAWRDPVTGWSAPTSFPMPEEGLADGPRLAADTSGRVVAAWHSFDSEAAANLGVYATTWVDATGWAPLRRLSEPGTEGFVVEASLDGSGGGAVVWLDRDSRVWVSFARSGVWSNAEQVPNARAALADAAFLGGGDLLVAWADPDTSAVRAVRGRRGAWSPSEVLQSVQLARGALVDALALAANGSGEAVVAWGRFEGGGGETVWTSRLRASR